MPFARTPRPPYYAVIFSSQRSAGDRGYAEAAARMADLAHGMPGFLGMETARDDAGFGITTAFFDSEEAIKRWRDHPEHAASRKRGREEWYRHFELRIARVERAYGADSAHDGPHG